MNNTLDERKAIMVLISQVQALRDTIQSTLYNSTAQEHSRYVSFKSYAITYNDLAERARQVLKISTVFYTFNTRDMKSYISSENREHELLARHIKNNTEIEGKLFTAKAEIESFDDQDSLIRTYNSSLYYKHTGRRIEEYKGNVYIKEYVDDSSEIIKKLQTLSSFGVSQYTSSVDSWMNAESYSIDDDSKKEALRQMFSASHVALIYGSAGTGKSTLLRHISNFWANRDKLFLANTHPAVDNMRRKVTAAKSEYSTIAKFLSQKNQNVSCDILFIDECSTVSNKDMRQILEKAQFKLLVLVGDVYQIESIYFGNWFSIAQMFIPNTSVFELTHPYRTTDDASAADYCVEKDSPIFAC